MIIIGHRGARGLAPENTLASLQRAIDCGVDEIEVDVRVTRDGVPVLSHGSSPHEAAARRRIARHTLSELRQHKADLATLDEALSMAGGKAVVIIEVKFGEPTGPVAAVIRAHRDTARIVLGSKSQKVLRSLHELLPGLPVTVIEPWSAVRASYRARQLGTKRISMRSWWLYKGFLRLMHRRGYQVVPYTMNDPRKVSRWQPYLYGVVTDFPDRFHK